ncbi:MAG: NADH-quinone oxidoreductase subunit M [Legionellales bacterium]|nr:NADH-quinone oxidoreductase subunit M [Legionellales bacterium]
MLYNFPVLSVLIWLPIIGAAIILMTGDDRNADAARIIAIVISTASLVLCVPLFFNFDYHTPQMQFVEHMEWIKQFGINYDLGVDGISMPFVILATYTTLVVVLASLSTIKHKVAQYLAAFLLMQGMMVGIFASTDAMLFYVFWEGILIPMYICIGVWGGSNRTYASIKFFLYTFLGSALMLVALLYLHVKADSFKIADFYPLPLSLPAQMWIFIAFFLAFAVKVPMWPVHTWLPDAHTEAPAGGSVILAALMLKMGVYGFLRFSLPIVPDACGHLAWFMIALSLVAIVYIGFVAIVQTDMKRLIAYSSISHMGIATLGCFMVYEIVRITHNYHDAFLSLEGGMVQMLSHAFSSGAMFLGVGVLYDRLHTRLIKDYGGVALKMPVFAALYMVFVMSNVGLPGTAGFVGEFMVIISSFRTHFWIAFASGMSLILGAAYTQWM